MLLGHGSGPIFAELSFAKMLIKLHGIGIDRECGVYIHVLQVRGWIMVHMVYSYHYSGRDKFFFLLSFSA